MARVFDCYWGKSGSGKSRAIIELIKKLFRETGKKSRAYIGDGGVETYYASGIADPDDPNRLVDLVDYTHLDNPCTIIELMVTGWMPVNGVWKPTKNEDYVLTAFESASSMGKYILGHNKGGLAWRAGRGEKIGQQKEEEKIKIEDQKVEGAGEAFAFGTNIGEHYKFAQPFLLDAIRKSRGLPNWVIWTGHPTKEAADTDEGGTTGDYGKVIGKKVIGMEAAGKALAPVVSKEFGNTLHFDTVTKYKAVVDPDSQKQIKEIDRVYRIYTRDHFDPDGNTAIEFRAVNRCPIPEMMPDYVTSIGEFYEKMAAAKQKERESLKQ